MRASLTCLFVASLGVLSPLVAQNVPSSDERSATIESQLRTVSQALASRPKDKQLLDRRAALHAAAGEPVKAIADYDRLLKLDPSLAAAFDARGSEQFKLGQIDASIADFDRYLKLRPDQVPWHWKRGISYYYAGRWEEGQRQFEGYQTVDDNDVENAVWRYLCMAHSKGEAAARADMLKIKRDPRVPMMEVYALYKGELQPDDVLTAVERGKPSPEELNARQILRAFVPGAVLRSGRRRCRGEKAHRSGSAAQDRPLHVECG